MKKLIAFLAFSLICFAAFPLTTFAKNDIRIFVDGVEQHYDQPAVIVNGRTFLPVRHIAEQTGSIVEWEQDSKTVHIFKNDDHIFFRLEATLATVNGKQKEMPQSFLSKKKRTMVPLRFISEELGLFVQWDGDNRHVYITTSESIELEKVNHAPEQLKKAQQITVPWTAEHQFKANQLLQDTDRLYRIENKISLGQTFLGIPYQYGAKVGEVSSFDCSSYIAYLLLEQGVSFPRVASEQATKGMLIPKEHIQRGDLLFFDTALNGKIEHVGIYLGENRMLHVSTSRGVQETELFDYWQDRYVVATRY